MSDMNWAKMAAFIEARLAEEPNPRLAAVAERILHVLEVQLACQFVMVSRDGSSMPLPFGEGMLEVAKNLTLELALQWHRHPNFLAESGVMDD